MDDTPKTNQAKAYVSLEERVAVEQLKLVASCDAAEQWRPMGTASLRTILADILLCTDAGKLYSTWHEEAVGHLGRRYSSPVEVGKNDPLFQHFKRVRQRGANPNTIGRSLFAFPSYIRNLARCGLKNLWVLDLVNCHMVIMRRRHPTLRHLAYYVEHREEVLASIPCDRQYAKELFIRMLYGGGTKLWREEHGITAPLPDFVRDFEADMREAERIDTAGRPDPGKIQYLLNTAEERRVMDAIERLLLSMGAVIHAYEHDGLCFTLAADATELVRACSSTCGYLVTVERSKTFEECVEALEARSGMEWVPGHKSWEHQVKLVARARMEPLSSHIMFAEIVLNEAQVSDDIPWPVTELFRLCPHAKELLWYDPEAIRVARGCWWQRLSPAEGLHHHHPPETAVHLLL
jgi:hypothetical protein